MSTSLKTPDDDARFDRLVDGALSPAEYKTFCDALLKLGIPEIEEQARAAGVRVPKR